MNQGYLFISAIPLPEINSDDEDNESEDRPLYSDDVIFKPVSVENLWNYVREKKQSKTDGLKQEYDVSCLFVINWFVSLNILYYMRFIISMGFYWRSITSVH